MPSLPPRYTVTGCEVSGGLGRGGISVRGGFEGCRDRLKLRECCSEIFDDLSGDDLRRWEVIGVVERLDTQPGDV